ncbi:MAG: SIR2 family protein [Bacteroidota bacterium]
MGKYSLDPVRHLLGNPSELAILFGAGVSLDSPTSFPSVWQMMKVVIDALAPDQKTRELLTHYCSNDRAAMLGPGQFIRFETLMSEVYPEGTEPTALLHLGNVVQPNSNHFALADLASRGAVLITTNFDLLVEYAFDALDVEWRCAIDSKEFDLFVQEFNSGDVKQPWLLKLHGSVNRPETISATLEGVAQGRFFGGTEAQTWTALRRVLEERHLLVLGYSGSDDFDVSPIFRTTRSDRQLVWVDHWDRDDVMTTLVSDEVDDDLAYKASWRLISGVVAHSVGRPGAREPQSVLMLRARTRDLLRRLSSAPKPASKISELERELTDQLRADIQRRVSSDSTKWLRVGMLLQRVDDLPAAVYCAENAIKSAERDSNAHVLAHAHLLAATCYDVLGEWDRMNRSLEVARATSLACGDESAQVEVTLLLGKRARLVGNRVEAIRLATEALESAERANMKRLAISALGNLAAAESDLRPKAALEYYNDGLQRARALGDFSIESKMLNDAFSTAPLGEDSSTFESRLKEALELVRAVGNVRGEVEVLGNLGMIRASRGEFSKAQALIDQAVHLADLVNYPIGSARCLSEIGYLLWTVGKHTDALVCLESAKTMIESSGNLKMLGTVLGRIGLVHKELENWEESRIALSQALQVDQRAGWIYGVIDDLQNLGVLADGRGDKSEAWDYYNQALYLARKSGYDAAYARNLGNVGKIFSLQNRHKEAQNMDEEALLINQRIGNIQGEVNTRINLAADFIHQGQLHVGLDHLRQARLRAREFNLGPQVAHINKVLEHFGSA